MKCLTRLCLIGLLAAVSSSVLCSQLFAAELIDDFGDQDLTEYTQTRVVDTNNTSNLTFSASGG